MGLAQYRVNIPITYTGQTQVGLFKKRLVPYSITFTDDELCTCRVLNARSPSRAYKKVLIDVKAIAEKKVKQVKKANEEGTFLILTGNTSKGFTYSHKFYQIDGYTLGTPQITKIQEWSEATMKELTNSDLTIDEFQEVFAEKQAKEKE